MGSSGRVTLNRVENRGEALRGALGRVHKVWWGVSMLFAVTLVVVTTQSSYTTYTYDTILLASIGAIALQLLQGTAGLVSVGNSAFLLCGAFVSVFCLRSGVDVPLDIVVAAAVSGIGGVIVG